MIGCKMLSSASTTPLISRSTAQALSRLWRIIGVPSTPGCNSRYSYKQSPEMRSKHPDSRVRTANNAAHRLADDGNAGRPAAE